jgi:hypothetical protein
MKSVSLLRGLLDCRQAGERPAQTIVRLYNDLGSPMNVAARNYIAAILLDVAFHKSNPKIAIYRREAGRAQYSYSASTNWYRTCRDAEIAAMLLSPHDAFKAFRRNKLET